MIDDARAFQLAKEKSQRDINKIEALMIKSALGIIDSHSNGSVCGSGYEVIEKLKERQYKLAKEM